VLNFDYGDKVVAGFSNIEVNVDVFCTWRKIYATTPNDTFKLYRELQWLLKCCWSCCYNSFLLSKLTASQVKHILMDSGVAITENVVVAGNPKTAVLLLLCLNQEK
jgi:hypothetical protein